MLSVLPWALLFLVVLAQGKLLLSYWGGDFEVYYAGAQALVHGEPLYDVAVPYLDGATLPFTYPPFGAVIIVPFLLLPLGAAAALFELATLAALIGVCWVVARRLPAIAGAEMPWGPLPLTALLLAMSLTMRPVIHTFYLGQVGIFLLLIVLLDTVGAGTGRWSKWGGALTGLAAGVKVTPAIFLVLMASTKRWGDLARAAAALAVTILIGFAVQPGEAWRYWTKLLFESNRVGEAARTDNTSLLGIVERWQLGTAGKAIWALAAIAVLMAGTWLATRWWPRDRLISVSLMAVAGLIISPISWDHHWVWAVVIVPAFAAVAIRAAKAAQRAPAIWMGLAALAMFAVAFIHPETIAADLAGSDGSLSAAAQLVDSIYALTGFLLLAAGAFGLRIEYGSRSDQPKM